MSWQRTGCSLGVLEPDDHGLRREVDGTHMPRVLPVTTQAPNRTEISCTRSYTCKLLRFSICFLLCYIPKPESRSMSRTIAHAVRQCEYGAPED